jgi:hypothetical protein
MPALAATSTLPAAPAKPKFSYQRRTPEDSVLRQIFVQQWPALQRELQLASDGQGLPKFLVKAVEGFLDCGDLSKGFLRLYCKDCHKDQLVAFSCKKRGICTSCDSRRMVELGAHICDSVIGEVPVRQFVVTLPPAYRYLLSWNTTLRSKVLKAVMTSLQRHYLAQGYDAGAKKPQFAALSVLQRFSGALRLWPHWHILVADGVWSKAPDGQRIFVETPPLDDDALWLLVREIATRATRVIDRHFAARRKTAEAANSDDNQDPWQTAEPALASLMRQSLFGRDELEALAQPPPGTGLAPATLRKVARLCMEFEGYNVHAATRVSACARERLEQLVRYVCRPVIAAKRLEDLGDGRVRIWLKNEWRGGKNAVVLTKRELATRILAQIPLPRRANLAYFGLWGPAAKDRALVVPALGARVEHNKRKGKAACGAADAREAEGAQPEVCEKARAAKAKAAETKLSWSQALQRAFGFDALKCDCGGRRKLIAVIMQAGQVERILRHIGLWQATAAASDDIVAIRGPPQSFDDAVDDAPGEQFDGVDDHAEVDWAA